MAVEFAGAYKYTHPNRVQRYEKIYKYANFCTKIVKKSTFCKENEGKWGVSVGNLPI